MTTQTTPTESQISQTIALIKARFKNSAIEKPVNRAVHEGYRASLAILAEGITRYETACAELTTRQGRAIAVLAVDYLRGECTQQVLVNVPLKA